MSLGAMGDGTVVKTGKRIVVLCDGTWNRYDASHPTNVMRMTQAIRLADHDGVQQVPIYLIGVGTGQGSTALARWLDKRVGGIFGWGLTQTLAEAYRALCFTYAPGDEIYVFGFSRGAYLARSLVGLIRATGIIGRTDAHLLPLAIRRYRVRHPIPEKRWRQGWFPPTHPRSDQSHAFRARVSPELATSQAEVDWRVAQGLPVVPVLAIRYLGLWDTVGALGIPGFFIAAPLINRGSQFHDHRLTSMVKTARHALSCDERRRAFAPTQWDNADELNHAALGHDSVGDLAATPQAALPYREEWFPGDHAGVGGGGANKGLASLAFQWVAEGAVAEGLALDDGIMATIRAEADVMAPVHAHRHVGLGTRIMRLISRDRDGPDRPEVVNPVTRDRLRRDPAYRPGSLRRVIDRLVP